MLRRHFGRVAFAALAFAIAFAAAPRLGRAQESEVTLGALLDQMRLKPRYNQSWKGAGELAVLFIPVGGGKWETNYSHAHGSYQAIMHIGMRAAGYGVLGHGFQLGGFAAADVGRMSYSMHRASATSSSTRCVALDSSAGLAFKWGTMHRRKAFVGIGFDLGLAVHHADLKNDDIRTQLGVASSTRLLFEFPGGDKDAWAVNFAFGLAGSIVKGEALESTDRITTRWLRVEPIVLLGATFGG
jgi:hypothetical protein